MPEMPSFTSMFDGMTCYCTPTDLTESKDSDADEDGEIPGPPPDHNIENGRFTHKWLTDPSGAIAEKLYMGTWDVVPGKQRKGIVFYKHDNGSHIHDDTVEQELLWQLADAGFVIAAVDMPEHGRTSQHPENESPTKVTEEEGSENETAGEVDIAVLALTDAMTIFKDEKKKKDLPIFAMGHSGTEQKGFFITEVKPGEGFELKAAIAASFSPLAERGEFDGDAKEVMEPCKKYLLKMTKRPSMKKRLSMSLGLSKQSARGSISL